MREMERYISKRRRPQSRHDPQSHPLTKPKTLSEKAGPPLPLKLLPTYCAAPKEEKSPCEGPVFWSKKIPLPEEPVIVEPASGPKPRSALYPELVPMPRGKNEGGAHLCDRPFDWSHDIDDSLTNTCCSVKPIN